MARARNIKPSFFKNEILGQEDPMISLLYISLWTLADKAGRLMDIPIRIKAETFPYRENLDVNGYLTVLSRLGFIRRYEVDGFKVIQILTFEKHQNPHHTEKPSELPEYSIELDGCEITVKEPLNNGYTPADSIKDSIKDSYIPEPEKPSKKPAKNKTSISSNFGISDAVRIWASNNGHSHLEQRLEHFIGACKSKGYTYLDWDQAFQNAIRDNWAKITVAPKDIAVKQSNYVAPAPIKKEISESAKRVHAEWLAKQQGQKT